MFKTFCSKFTGFKPCQEKKILGSFPMILFRLKDINKICLQNQDTSSNQYSLLNQKINLTGEEIIQ